MMHCFNVQHREFEGKFCAEDRSQKAVKVSLNLLSRCKTVAEKPDSRKLVCMIRLCKKLALVHAAVVCVAHCVHALQVLRYAPKTLQLFFFFPAV